MDTMQAKRPSFSLTEAQQLAKQLYGLNGTCRPLPSERDQNFQFTTQSGEQFTLKFSHAAEQRQTLNLQHSAMQHIAQRDAGLRCPQVQPTRVGETIAAVSAADGPQHFVTLLSYLPGKLFVHNLPHTPELLISLGSFMGRIDKALADFSHPATPSALKWDLKNGPALIRAGLPHVSNSEHKQTVSRFLDAYETWAAPRLPELRISVIHNDANDYNVLAAGERVTGLIDFGDMVRSHTIFELAITAAYALLGKTDPVTAVSAVVTGYHTHYPLTDLELELLYHLVCLRLCTSVTNAAIAKQQEPNNEYLTVTEQPAWAALAKLAGTNPDFAHDAFRHACGLSPFPRNNLIVNSNVYTQIGEPTPTAFREKGRSKETLLNIRNENLGPSLSISYKKPLKIVRSWMQYLYDEDGNRYLDAVNNVPHVGHCHPHVVEAAVRQTACCTMSSKLNHHLCLQKGMQIFW